MVRSISTGMSEFPTSSSDILTGTYLDVWYSKQWLRMNLDSPGIAKWPSSRYTGTRLTRVCRHSQL